jgi:hypothetical protein
LRKEGIINGPKINEGGKGAPVILWRDKLRIPKTPPIKRMAFLKAPLIVLIMLSGII